MMTMTTKCKYIDDYIESIRSKKVQASKKMHQAVDYIEKKLSNPDVKIDTETAEKAVELIERYFKIKLFPWELFVIGLVNCYYQSTDMVVFSEFLIVMGRGNGKNGFISGLAWWLSTHYHGVQGYNIDIVANSEDQAKTSFNDIYDMLDDTWKKSQKFFYKSKEEIKNLKTKSYIKYNTSNARTKDGKRSACLIFDELHEYENSSTIQVFRSGFGKRKYSRIFDITTNGYVREGVLDDKLRIAEDVLNGVIPESSLCPLIYELDSDEEANDHDTWEKANPSLPYLPTLKAEIEKEWIEKDYDNSVRLDLYTKRFNRPRSGHELAVTDYKNIKATNRELPDLKGWNCTVGIDYATMNDWVGVNLHFRRGDLRYDINHAWMCQQAKELHRVKAPWQQWADDGHLTVVDEVSIPAYLIAAYIQRMGQIYNIRALAMDNYRWPLMAEALKKIGFDAADKDRVHLVRPSDIMKVEPIIQECFNRQYFCWGDNPTLRWSVNNTKRVPSGVKAKTKQENEVNTGNYVYAKIEPKSRKTDPWMALVASMTIESCLGTGQTAEIPLLGAIVL